MKNTQLILLILLLSNLVSAQDNIRYSGGRLETEEFELSDGVYQEYGHDCRIILKSEKIKFSRG